MSITSDKKSIASSLSVITSLTSSLDTSNLKVGSDLNVNTFNSDSEDPISFILELFIALIGVEVLKKLLKETLNSFVPNITGDIKKSLKKSLISDDSNKPLKAEFVNNGYNYNLSELDYNKKFKNNTTNDKTIVPGSLDQAIGQAVNSPNTPQTFKGLVLNFNPNTNILNVKASDNSKNTNEFMSEIIDGISFIASSVLIALIIDYIFGTLIKSANKTRNEVYNDEMYNKIVSNMITNDDTSEEAFDLSPNDLDFIEQTINNKLNGILPLDYDCGIVESSFSLNSIDLINASNDPVEVFDSELDQLTPSDPNQANRDDLSSNKLNSVNNNIKNNNKYQNKSSVKSKVYKDFFSGILLVIVKNTALSPQMVLLQSISKSLAGNVNQVGTGIDMIKQQKNLIACLLEGVKGKITEFLFNKLKTEIIKKIKPFGLAILNEKLNAYIGIISSLKPF